MTIHLSDHFTYGKLLRFTFPSMLMMLFTSIYGVVDGFFISNYAGKTAFAAVNLVMPFIMVLGGVGTMLGTGGSALVAKTLGEGHTERANQYFTMMIEMMVVLGVTFSVLGIAFIRPVSYLFGATDDMIGDCVLYGRITLAFNTAFLMQYAFQSFLITAERPKLGLTVTIIAGVTNMVLDALFVRVFRWGVAGAAVATGLSQCVGGLIPLASFLNRKNNSLLRFAKAKFELRPIILACGNGASEMMSSLSSSITGILYNRQLMAYAGENGVSAYGVVMYTSFIFIAAFIGYSNGSAPVVSYHYGAQNHTELKSLLRKSLTLVICGGGALFAAGMLLTKQLAAIFVSYDAELLELTVRALRICFTGFVVMGVNTYASSFFTALNDGAVSAAISFLRTLALPVAAILLLPLWFGLDGIWVSLPAAEALALCVSVLFLVANRKKYHY